MFVVVGVLTVFFCCVNAHKIVLLLREYHICLCTFVEAAARYDL